MAWYYGDEAAMKNRELDYSAKDNEYNWGMIRTAISPLTVLTPKIQRIPSFASKN